MSCACDRKKFCSYPRCDWAPNKYDYQLSNPRYGGPSGCGGCGGGHKVAEAGCCRVGGLDYIDGPKDCGCGCGGGAGKYYRGSGIRPYYRYSDARIRAERLFRDTRLDRYYSALDPLRGRIFAGGFDQPDLQNWDGDQ